MIALLLAAAIGQFEDVAELHERWQIEESVYNDGNAQGSGLFARQISGK